MRRTISRNSFCGLGFWSLEHYQNSTPFSSLIFGSRIPTRLVGAEESGANFEQQTVLWIVFASKFHYTLRTDVYIALIASSGWHTNMADPTYLGGVFDKLVEPIRERPFSSLIFFSAL